MLVIKYTENTYADIQRVLESEFKNFFIRTDTQKKDYTEKVIEVQMKKGNHEQSLQKIRDIKCVQSCILISSNGEFSE